VDQLNTLKGLTGTNSIGNEQIGAYAQAGYDLMNGAANGRSLMPFVRYEILNTQQSVPAGFSRDSNNLIRAVVAGLNYKPISQIVLKGDYEWFTIANGKAVDQANLSVGFVF
jgi:opacity protein-like surface antigen